MPSAWEAQTVDLVIGVPHIGNVTMEWVMGLISMEQPWLAYYSFQRGMPIDSARNLVCNKVIELGARGVLFLDSDVILPRDGLRRLVEHNLPIVSGLYYRKQATNGIYAPAMWTRAPEGAVGGGMFAGIVDFPKGRLVDVEVIGMGACWVSRRVLEEWTKCETCGGLMTQVTEKEETLYSCPRCKTEPRKVWWFYFSKERTEAPGGGMSEDFYFCQEAKSMGYKILVDTSIACRHIGYFAVEDGRLVDAHV